MPKASSINPKVANQVVSCAINMDIIRLTRPTKIKIIIQIFSKLFPPTYIKK